MINIMEFRTIVADEMDLLPKQFFVMLNGGVLVTEEAKLHMQSINDDLYVMGEYQRGCITGQMIVLYYGSFDKVYGQLDYESMKKKIRETLRHEFRHHMEYLSGTRDLEIEDEVAINMYLKTHQ